MCRSVGVVVGVVHTRYRGTDRRPEAFLYSDKSTESRLLEVAPDYRGLDKPLAVHCAIFGSDLRQTANNCCSFLDPLA